MSIPEYGASKKEEFKFDESIFTPNPMARVELPSDEKPVFAEEQNFDQIWLWAIMGIQMVVVMIPLLLSGQSWGTIATAFLAVMLGMVLLGALKLNTWMDADGVHYKMKVFHWKVQTIPWEEIDQIHVRKYSPIKEYGGWGIKYGSGGKAFNVRGDYGIQIVKKDGKRILIGTQKPEEAGQFLIDQPLLV